MRIDRPVRSRALTERLAVRGKAGAEEMGELLNVVFEQLLTAAYDYGANGCQVRQVRSVRSVHKPECART
jgi:hypothetical protein